MAADWASGLEVSRWAKELQVEVGKEIYFSKFMGEGPGNAIHVNAYKIASLVPGSLSLILADIFAWKYVFLVTGLFMLPGIVMTILIKEPDLTTSRPKTLKDAIIEPFKEFKNSVKEDRQPLTSLERSLKIQSWVEKL